MVFLVPHFCPLTNKTKQLKKKKRTLDDREIKLSFPADHPLIFFFFLNNSQRNKIVYTVVISFLLSHVSIWKENLIL